MQEKVRTKVVFCLKRLQNRQNRPDKNTTIQNWSNPPEIRQKLRVRQKYFLPARQLSNPPELSKSGGENRHLATLQQTNCRRI
jgi:hypothetical protein